jgi:hypothetical protein
MRRRGGRGVDGRLPELPLCLPRRLLFQTDAVRAVCGLRLRPGLLLSEAHAVCALRAALLLSGRLLSQAVRLLLAAVLSGLVHVRCGAVLHTTARRLGGN